MKAMALVSLLVILFVSAAALGQAGAGDPHKGEFTMKEATAGLTGSGPLMVTMETTKGTFTCELFDKQAPLTVANFVGLARGVRSFLDANTGKWEKKPFYDGLIFHRVIPNFMIQGGDFMGTGKGVGPGGKSPGYTFKDEFSPDLRFDKKGQLAMANAGPTTNGSQFFITDSMPKNLNDKHTIFGQCDPASLVGQIAGVETVGSRPKQDVVMKKVTIAYQAPGKGKATKGKK